MEDELRFVAEVTGASRATRGRRIQSLWSGYGEIFRAELSGADVPSVVVKWVTPPANGRESGGDRSHARKCRSYDVEATWYRDLAKRCDDTCRVPKAYGSRASRGEWLIVLEDLDAAGFGDRRRRATAAELDACLAWLASFHARFLGVAPRGLWKTGTYWHLGTRPDELVAMDDEALRDAAPLLDRRLRECTFETILHGDAKLANFCFARSGAVAAVDFQYVGGGPGVKDVAYLLSGEPNEARHIDTYFRHLREAASPSIDRAALEAEWRALYPIACVDFYRFLAGWSKADWRADRHAQQLTREVLRTLV